MSKILVINTVCLLLSSPSRIKARCLPSVSVRDFSRGQGCERAPVIPPVPTQASMTSRAQVSRLFSAPPPPTPLGAWMWGKGRTVALQTWGEEHTCHLYIWGHLRETISSQIRRVMGGRGQQGRLSLLPTTHPPFPLLPTTLKSDYRAPQTSYYFVPRLLNLVLHLCVDNSRHVLSRAGESKYIGDLSTPGQGLKREQ